MCSDSYSIPILSLFFLYHPYIPYFLIQRIFHFLVLFVLYSGAFCLSLATFLWVIIKSIQVVVFSMIIKLRTQSTISITMAKLHVHCQCQLAAGDEYMLCCTSASDPRPCVSQSTVVLCI